MWFEAYQDTKLNRPILNKYMEVINYNELDNYLIENPDAILYVSILEDKNIRDFEKKLRVVFKNNQFNKSLLYLNITDELNSKKIKSEMVSKYSVNDISMANVPSIMVFEDGVLKFIYDIKDNGYDIENIKLFVNGIVFSKEEDGIDG